MGKDAPWGVSSFSHRLGAPVLGSYTGRQAPLADLRTAETNRRAKRILDSTYVECPHTGVAPRQGRDSRQEMAPMAPGFTTTNSGSTAAQAEGLLQPRLLDVTTWQWIYGCHHQEESSDVRHRGDSVLGQHLSRAMVATAGAYSSSPGL